MNEKQTNAQSASQEVNSTALLDCLTDAIGDAMGELEVQDVALYHKDIEKAKKHRSVADESLKTAMGLIMQSNASGEQTIGADSPEKE